MVPLQKINTFSNLVSVLVSQPVNESFESNNSFVYFCLLKI